MIGHDDVGGVHVKYLYHCPRQLWLYVRGLRPEGRSPLVAFGEAVHETSFTRTAPSTSGRHASTSSTGSSGYTK